MARIGDLQLTNLALPGTHNAGTYKRFNGQNIVNKYRDCQEEDAYTQLLYGVRFLDIRPGAILKNNKFEFWIYHDFLSTKVRVDTILKDVQVFLQQYPSEVVFVDFHEFPKGFDKPGAYEALANMAEEYLGPFMLRNSPSWTTLRSAVQKNTRAVVSFDKDENLRSKYLPGVSHIWGNTDDLDKLRDTMTHGQSMRRGRLYSAMCQITAQGVWNVLIDKYRGGVRGIAHKHNFYITDWYKQGGEIRHFANIIALDYVVSSDLVDVCKAINLERAR